MLVTVSRRPPTLFAASEKTAEKRDIAWTLRLTSSERDALEEEAAKRGVTAINLIRLLIADGLGTRRKPKRG